MNKIKYPPIDPKFIESNKPIVDSMGNTVEEIGDFWRWAFSGLMGNMERAALGEYIVACALGVQDKPRATWGSYDLRSRENIKVEVKTSGYLQTWGQRRLSDQIFGIQPTRAWDSETDLYEKEKKRQADIYVFCVHACVDKEIADPTILRQWEFYVISTKKLDAKNPNQQKIGLKVLIKIGAEKCSYEELHSKIIEIYKRDNPQEIVQS